MKRVFFGVMLVLFVGLQGFTAGTAVYPNYSDKSGFNRLTVGCEAINPCISGSNRLVLRTSESVSASKRTVPATNRIVPTMNRILSATNRIAFFESIADVRSIDSIPADPKDVGSMEGILAALYDVISGPAGQTRNWDRMRTLFIPEARLIPTGKRPDGSAVRRVLMLEEYISRSGPQLEKNGFFESEIGRTVDKYGGIVQVFSAYAAKQKADDATPFMRGINSIQLWNDGNRWWIVTIFWEAETKENPVPEKYLGIKK